VKLQKAFVRLRPIFTRIHCPVLVLMAEHDMQVPPEDGMAICSLVAGPCEVVVPGLSHIPRDDSESKGAAGLSEGAEGPGQPGSSRDDHKLDRETAL
jgi:hypothetical protein